MMKRTRTLKNYFNEPNWKTLTITLLDKIEVIGQIDHIVQEETIDIRFIDCYDFSQSLGILGDSHNPQILKKRKR